MRIERTAKTVIAGLMSVACLASVAACGPGSSSNKANTETEAVSTDLGDTKYELKLWDGAGLKTFDDQLIEAFQKKYPNITIKATYDPDNTSQQNARASSPPPTPRTLPVSPTSTPLCVATMSSILTLTPMLTVGSCRIPRLRSTAWAPTVRSVPAASTQCRTVSR